MEKVLEQEQEGQELGEKKIHEASTKQVILLMPKEK